MTAAELIPAELPTPMASGYSSMIVLVLVVLGFMLLVQRPLRKQQAAQRELQNSIAEGSRVMLTSGMFGTVTHLGDKQAIVELAPGLEVTVLRQAISKAVTPADEEFEFSDEVPAQTGASDLADGAHAAGTESYPAADAGVQQQGSGHPTTDHLTTDAAFDPERPIPGGENR